MSNILDIAEYLKRAHIDKNSALNFLTEDSFIPNVNHSYIVRKIISNLEVRKHLDILAPLLKVSDSKEILMQILNNQNPTLMKQIIEMDCPDEKIPQDLYDEYGSRVSPYIQLRTIDDSNENLSLVPQPKRSIFRSLFSKSKEESQNSYSEPQYTKAEKIIMCYFRIPEEIEAKKDELATLNWYEVSKRGTLRREIHSLEAQKEKFHQDIIEYKAGLTTTTKKPEVQEWWKNYYLSHEQQMLEYLSFALQNPNNAELQLFRANHSFTKDDFSDDKSIVLQYSLEDFFGTLEASDTYISDLKRDIICHFNICKFALLEKNQDKDLSTMLDDLLKVMGENLVIDTPSGFTGYRTYDLKPVNNFMAKASPGKCVERDMAELSKEYEKLKGIENQDEYVDKAVEIYLRFMQIHPLMDGNGRTSRALFDVMLANRGIIPPILFDTRFDTNRVLCPLENEWLYGDNKVPLQDYVKSKIAEVNGYNVADERADFKQKETEQEDRNQFHA